MVDCDAGETIAALEQGPSGIAVFDVNVFWANSVDGSIMTWHDAALPTLWFMATANGPDKIGANAHQVCWTDYTNSLVECKSDAAAKFMPHKIIQMAVGAQPSSIVLDDNYAYWTNAGSGEAKNQAVPAINPGTSAVQLGTTPGGNPDWIAVDATGVAYWVNKNSGTIMSRAPSDLQQQTFIVNQPGISGLAVDANDVFWSSSTGKTVFKAPRLTGTPVTTLASNQLYPEQIAIDATHVYWWNQGDGTIMKAPKSGGAASVVICGQTDVHFAVSATHVYWTDRKKGTVKRIPK